ncbi:MAG: response regulator [Planctomycetes bacterium]|nr:response regulator [Planctomycetota bacterium]
MLSRVAEGKTRTGKILVVDDEQDIVTIIGKVLSKSGYDVVTACDGLEGIAKAESEMPDLILLDNIMPNMDGPTALAKLKASEATQGIPVIVVTALADVESIVFAQKGGAVDYVVKPFDYDTLLEKIAQTLDSKD